MGELGVEGMDALDDQHGMCIDTQLVAGEHTLTGGEVELGELYLLALEQGIELGIEEGEVKGVERLKVVLAMFIERCEFAVDEVVVEREGHRMEAICHELYGEALAEGGLARGGGSRYEDDACLAAIYVVGNACYALLLQCFGHIDKVGGMAGTAGCVEVAHGAHAHNLLPMVVLAEDAEHLVLTYNILQDVGVLAAGHTQQEAVVVSL